MKVQLLNLRFSLKKNPLSSSMFWQRKLWKWPISKDYSIWYGWSVRSLNRLTIDNKFLTNNLGSKKADKVKKSKKGVLFKACLVSDWFMAPGDDCRLPAWKRQKKGATQWHTRSECSRWNLDTRIAPALGIVSFHCGMTSPNFDVRFWMERRCDKLFNLI